MARRSRPDVVFLAIAATAAFVSTLVFTIAPVYRFRTAGLDNLQLVLVGTVMEAAVFLLRDPDRGRRRPVVAQVVRDRRPRRHRARAPRSRRRSRRSPACSPGRPCGGSPTRSRAGRRSPGWPASSATRTGRCCASCSCGRAGSGRRPRSSPCRCRSSLGINVALRAPLIIGGVPVARARALARRGRWARSTSSPCRRRTARAWRAVVVGRGRCAGDPGAATSCCS